MDRRALDVEEIYFAAGELGSPGERAAYLDEVCGPDSDLRRRVERLLAARQRVGDFLDAPAAGMTVSLGADAAPEDAGAVIGPYKLMEQIGEGGMGVVYVAEQVQPVRRRVALKVIKPGMDSRQVVARFEAERQALALMDHPNIAKVLDAGATPSGQPYLVMELVRGVPITEYCDEQQLTIRERLKLFVLVCRAVQHAHQKGVIHRNSSPPTSW
jgi:serine/threonine-protein kinase